MVVLANAVLDGVEPFARLRRRGAVGQVAAGGEAHAHDRVAGLKQGHHHRAVGLRTRVRLDVCETAAEQLLGPLDRQRLDFVGWSAALIVAAARIALRIFVGQHRALRFEHRAADDVLRCDQLDLRLLALKLMLDAGEHRRIGVGEPAGEEAVGLDIVEVGGGGHQAGSCSEGLAS